MKTFSQVLLFLCFILLFSSFARGEVKIAVVGPLSGSSSSYGKSQLQGVQLAVEQYNSASRALDVEIVPADDRGDSSLVGILARDLVFEEGVSAFIGCVNSSCTHVLEMLCVKMQKPQITCVSTDPSITRAGSPWIFRSLADDRKQARVLAEYILGDLQAKRVALLTLDNRYGKMGARTLGRILEEREATLVFQGTIKRGRLDRSDLVRSVKSTHPNAVVLWSLFDEAAQVLLALRRQGYGGVVLGPDGVTTPRFLERVGRAAEGMIVTLPFNRARDSAKTKTFLKQYKERWGERADSFAAHAFDGASILLDAIESSGSEAFALRRAIAATKNYDGVSGRISFDDSGNYVGEVELAIVRRGEFIPLQP